MAATARLDINAIFSDTKSGPVSGTLAAAQSFISSLSLDADSTPAITMVHPSVQALSAGALTLDLLALTDIFGVSQSFTGLDIFLAIIQPLGANNMTFVQAGANGYGLFQATTPTTIHANSGFNVLYSPAGYGTVGAGAKDITVAGTGTQTFRLFLAGG